MHPARRYPPLLALVLLAACGGHRPLATIEPVPGSRTRNGGEIVPLDSGRGHEIRRLDIHGREIVPLDSARRARPIPRAAPAEREIRPRAGGRTNGNSNGSAGGNANGNANGREIRPVEGEVVPLDGTIWNGMTADGEIAFEFLIGGILKYTNADGRTWTNGTWHQEANVITFEMNDHYADYTGHIRGTRMSGSAHNTAGRTWDWYATRE